MVSWTFYETTTSLASNPSIRLSDPFRRCNQRPPDSFVPQELPRAGDRLMPGPLVYSQDPQFLHVSTAWRRAPTHPAKVWKACSIPEKVGGGRGPFRAGKSDGFDSQRVSHWTSNHNRFSLGRESALTREMMKELFGHSSRIGTWWHYEILFSVPLKIPKSPLANKAAWENKL